MRLWARTLFTGGATAVVAIWLAGCASGMSKEECAAADWGTIGYEDGLHGLPPDRIGAHRVACAKHQIAPSLAAYTEGRESGLREYCQPKNGFRVGVAGGRYANVCSGSSETAFVNGYQYGRQIHAARVELRNARAQLNSAEDALANTEAAMSNATAELVSPKVPGDRRAWLATELVRLTQERGRLIERIGQLKLEAQELAVNVQQLERQSPYPL